MRRVGSIRFHGPSVDARIPRLAHGGTVRLLSIPLFACVVAAQHPVLNPTSNLTLYTLPTQGQFAFSSIDIPAGVRVNFNGDHPVQIRCDGDAVIRGQLDVDASFSTSGPGATLAGSGSPGVAYGIGCYGTSVTPGNGIHVGNWGQAVPFSLIGGSPGGETTFYSTLFGSNCLTGLRSMGGGGGGTIVLEAGGRIDVYGRVSANGASGGWSTSVGSGGSLLLRGLGGLTVHSSGLVQATAIPTVPNSYAGVIRLEAYGAAPVLIGLVDPPPITFRLPRLEEMSPPIIGNQWGVRVQAPRGDGVFLAASFRPGSYTGPYGVVGIDVPTAITFALATMPGTGHDPLVTNQLAVPLVPGLIGLDLWTAGLDWYTVLPPRYTNTIHSTVR
ncbi:MAG: hypothetical protein KDC98_01755 [Planctomycetes bacterium]|nr:hypothetical protein [Planctomycetota bacterium]